MVKSIIMFLGGIALFIYGITALSDFLKKSAGNKFKNLIERVIDNPYLAVLAGFLITLVTNSSSVVIVLIIGLVRAGIITSKKSIGLIIGSNIGKTMAAFIVSLPVGDYAYILLLIGLILMFMKNIRVKNIGGIVLSLGLLFVGLNIMGEGVKPLISSPVATNLFLQFSKETFGGSFLGFLFGTLFTGIIQSSAATNAIIQKLYSLNNLEGVSTLTLRGALPIVSGANIGTTVTGVLAAIGGNEDSKRTAVIHTSFNVFGGLLFVILVKPFTSLIQSIEDLVFTPYSMFSIATAHFLQNLITGIIVFIFANQLLKFAELLVPVTEEKVELVFDEGLIEKTPEIALEFSKKALDHMTKLTYEFFLLTRKYSFTNEGKLVEEANTYEMVIDELDGKIHTYLIKIIIRGISSFRALDLSKLLDIAKDLERIGDHLSNIIEFFEKIYNENHVFTEEAIKDLNDIYNTLDEMFNLINESIYSNFKILPEKVLLLEEEIDALEEHARRGYIRRLKEGKFEFNSTSNYTDILSDLERIGDHLNNIANIIINPIPEHVEITGLKHKI